MKDKYFHIGSIKAKFGKLAKLCQSSLTDILKAIRWLIKLKWLDILKATKLIIEIVRSLLLCDQTVHFVQVAG